MLVTKGTITFTGFFAVLLAAAVSAADEQPVEKTVAGLVRGIKV